jgi:microcystin-dependent protein
MSEPYLGEIRIVGFNFPPRGWATCDGQILPINQNQALFSLLGTTYGGDGRVNFALPDLRGRAPVHFGASPGSGNPIIQGERGGVEAVVLNAGQLPAHTHTLEATAEPASTTDPTGAVLAKQARFGPAIYAGPDNLQSLHPSALGSAGGGAAHSNMQPYHVLNFVIALQGIFPSPS